MESRAHVIAAGLFVVVLTIGLIATSFWLSRESLDRERYLVVSRIPISGLHVKAAVRLRGVDVGKVDSIAFDAQDPRTIRVGISVDRSAPITHGTYAQLGFQGITGLSYIALDDDGSDARPRAGPEPLSRIELRPSLLDRMSGSGQDIMVDAAAAVAQVRKLLSDENLARLSAALRNSEAASRNVAELTAALQPAAHALPGLVERTAQVMNRADTVAGDLHQLAGRLDARMNVLDQVGAGAQAMGAASQDLSSALLERTLPRLDGALDELSRTSRGLDRVLHDLQLQPQSLVFGRPAGPPGPGEPGYSAPAGTR